MHVSAQLAALIAIMSVGVIYGTDAFCVLVQRPALARVDDATLTAVMGNVHRFGDRRLPVPGMLGMIASATACVLAAMSGRRGRFGDRRSSTGPTDQLAVDLPADQRADQPCPHRRGRRTRDTDQCPLLATRLGPGHRAPGNAARPGCRCVVHESHELTTPPLSAKAEASEPRRLKAWYSRSRSGPPGAIDDVHGSDEHPSRP